METQEALEILQAITNLKNIDGNEEKIIILAIRTYIENSIPKEAIEEKKQWLEENILDNDYASESDKDIAEYQVDILQDLLENK